MAGEPREELSEREIEILCLVATGVTNREIAARLVISPNTVKVHLRNIFAKLGVESRTEATLVAIQNGWVAVPGGTSAPIAGEEAASDLPVPAAPPFSWKRRVLLLAALVGSLLLAFWPRPASRSQERSDALSDHLSSASAPVEVGDAQRWSARAPLPSPRERFASVSFAGRVILIGGDTSLGVTGDVDIYDPASDTWSQGAPKPTPVSNVGAAVLGTEVFVPGGYDSEERVLSTVEVYQPDKDTWRQASPLPAPRCGYAIATAGGKLYLFGGWDGARYTGDVLIYNPSEDRWSTGTPMGQGRGFAAAATVDGRIYVVGGYDESGEMASCEVYDPALEGSGKSPWKALAPMSQPRGGLALAAVGKRLYAVGGGWDGGLAYSESYDIANDRWLRFPSPVLGQWRTLGMAAVDSTLGTTLYAMGGWTGDRAALNQAYRASLNVYLPTLP